MSTARASASLAQASADPTTRIAAADGHKDAAWRSVLRMLLLLLLLLCVG
jgi:hypothetical protein